MWPVSMIGEDNINILKQSVISQKNCTPLLKNCSIGDNYFACFVSTQPLRRDYFQAALRASSAKK